MQKRKVVQQILEAATLRLIELQNQLKDIEISEFLYVDQTIIEENFVDSATEEERKTLKYILAQAKKEEKLAAKKIGSGK